MARNTNIAGDSFQALKVRGGQILGLSKLAVKAIETEGLKLREAEVLGVELNIIQWVNKGNIKQEIFGFANALHHYLMLRSKGTRAGSQIEIHSSDIGDEGFAKIIAVVLGTGVTLYDEFKRSSFLKLAAIADVKVAFGSAVLSWPGASQESKGTAVAHELGVTPKVIIATPRANGEFTSVPVVGARSTESFTLVGLTLNAFSPALNKTQTYDWVALG